jgi:hypothetical protein
VDNRFIRIERSIEIVRFIPYNEEYYPGKSLSQAIAAEADRTEDEKRYFLIADASTGMGTLRDKVTAVTEKEMNREQHAR